MKNQLLILSTALCMLSCGNGNTHYDASGIFEATEVIVSARGTGELLQFDAEEGQAVEARKQIGYIDTTQLHLKRLQLLAGMKSVESRHYNVARQIASIKQQIATQHSEYKRYQNLVQANAANQKQLDDISASIALLEKQLSAQTETLESSNQSLTSEGRALEAQVAQIEDQIAKCIIYSPIDGIILSKYAEPGELAMQGRSLFKVADMQHIHLRAYITADLLTALKLGQQVRVFADQGKADSREYQGTVTWIADKAEFTPKTIQTRNERANLVYAVKVAVANDGFIKKGMYGEFKID